MRLRLHNVEVALADIGDDAAAALGRAVAARLALPRQSIGTPCVIRRALDVRRQRPRYSYLVDVEVPDRQAKRLCGRRDIAAPPVPVPRRLRCHARPDGPQPVVVGAGPAGLFAALTLAEAGWAPCVIERGPPVERRARDVSRLYAHGVLQPDSNVCYGEGGAGTFSDGKLYTRVGDARVDAVMAALVRLGADPDIRIDHRPHLGTDRLVALLRAVRARLLDLGCTLRFDTAISDVLITNGRLHGVRLRDGERVAASHVILATGHSARPVWEALAAHGLPLEARPFAMGFRVEHPQAMIDAIRYGAAELPGLPAADYRLAHNEDAGAARRGIYSFCMCPGGVVVTTPTEPEALCINGMSHASRRGRYANSALVVSCGPADFARAGHTGVFAGVAFQEAIERRAYAAGGGGYAAPAARVSDFAAGRESSGLGPSSYRRGLQPADLGTLYPPEIIGALRRALGRFDRQLRGFVTAEAHLIGVETRTAAPVRVPRDDTMQALGARGLYPAGEGMGYGGGIVSAAVDGIRAAEAVLEQVGAVASAA